MREAGQVARLGAMRKLYKILEEKHEELRPLGRPIYEWENNIKMDHKNMV
jgi:hypothetical protein